MNRIYVFSGTGTNLAIGKELGKALEAEVLSIPKLMNEGIWSIKGDTIGFVVPCYYGELPQMVKRFIEDAVQVAAGYVFLVATAGGHTAYTAKNLETSLKKRQTILNYSKSVIVASNYMQGWYYDMLNPKTPALLQDKIEKAHLLVEQVASDVQNRVNRLEPSNYLRYKVPQWISPKRYIKDTRPWDTEFTTSETCNSCGICQAVCPVNNIEMREGKPRFKRNCQRCMACVQYCPQGSFVINGKPMTKTKYVHPDVTLKEIIEFNKSYLLP